MRKKLTEVAICVTICGLFVLAVFAQRQAGLLGPETSRIALATTAVLPPGLTEVAVQEGPVPTPDPIDLPALSEGPVPTPDPIDLPVLAEGPVPTPDPIDLPSRG